jgi:hypothetical protein
VPAFANPPSANVDGLALQVDDNPPQPVAYAAEECPTMLKLFPARESNCEARSRRRFLLEVGSIAPLGLTLPALLQSSARGGEAGKAKKDVNCILIWTRGGTSHHDTLDPKPEAPADVRGEFGVASLQPGHHVSLLRLGGRARERLSQQSAAVRAAWDRCRSAIRRRAGGLPGHRLQRL